MFFPALDIEVLTDYSQIPFALLELADPSTILVESYLKTGTCIIAKLESKIVGVLVLDQVDCDTNEIKNISILESEQGKGFGKKLLLYSEEFCRKKGYKKILIGTGNSSFRQLSIYQQAGFEMCRIEQNYFLKNYSEAIFENGLQCKHLIVLEKKL